MCYLIAVGTQDARKSVEEALGFKLLATPRGARLSAGKALDTYLVDVGQCACHCYRQPVDDDDLVRLRNQYRGKGWPAARIRRALDQHRKLGGLELGMTHRIARAVEKLGKLSLLVYWANGFWADFRCEDPHPATTISAERLMEAPHLIQPDRPVRLVR